MLFFFCLMTFGQSNNKKFTLSGKLSGDLDSKMIMSQTFLELLPKNEWTLTDSLGNFTFNNLISGDYYLRANEYNSKEKIYVRIDSSSITNFECKIKVDCKDLSKEKALADIKKGMPYLIVEAGASLYKQEIVEKKYHFIYNGLGCQLYIVDCAKQYNETVFEYLDHKYGTKWRTEVRRDVIGLELK